MSFAKPAEVAIATLALYKNAAIDAGRALYKNWLIIPASIAAFLFFKQMFVFASPLGMAGGFIVGIVEIILVTLYYSWLADSLQRTKLSFHDLYKVDWGLFSNVISVAFVIFIAQFLVGTFSQLGNEKWIMFILQLGIVFVFNAVPEVIYIRRTEGFNGLIEAGVFTRDNWIEWYIPFIILLLPWIMLDYTSVVKVFSTMNGLLPPLIVIQGTVIALPSVNIHVSTILGVVIVNWYMLFRGFLFKDLESGTRRQRIFRSRQK